MNKSNFGKTLVIGSGKCAAKVAEELLKKKIETVILPSSGNPVHNDIKLLSDSALNIITGKIVSCAGAVGNFEILIDADPEEKRLCADTIIIAEQTKRKPLFEQYGLKETSSVISLSATRNKSTFASAETIVFLAGLKKESDPLIFEELMSRCMDIQSQKKRKIYIFANNLKVAGNNLEALYRKTREKGVIYFRFTKDIPVMDQDDRGRVAFEFADEITNQKIKITADMVVVDEIIAASRELKKLSRIMGLEMDENGFIQADNVHRLSVYTNRKGIFAVGPGRRIDGVESHLRDAALAVLNSGTSSGGSEQATGKIDPRACVSCLTCFRSCVHKAVLLTPDPVIIEDACAGCGICYSLCPGNAIDMIGFDEKYLFSKIKAKRLEISGDIPVIAAFCCARSSARAMETAAASGRRMPPGFVIAEVPCAGIVSVEQIYSAFKNGADGALILTCHEGNCHSGQGNLKAWEKAKYAAGFFKKIGIDPKRIKTASVASNMAGTGCDIVSGFEQVLSGLGRLLTNKDS